MNHMGKETKAYGFRLLGRADLVLLLFPLLLEEDLVVLVAREDDRVCLPEEALLLPLSCRRLLRADLVEVSLDFDWPDWAAVLVVLMPASEPNPANGSAVRTGIIGRPLPDSEANPVGRSRRPRERRSVATVWTEPVVVVP